eukprot:2917190-Pleurochrysis_carterae.AAC.2
MRAHLKILRGYERQLELPGPSCSWHLAAPERTAPQAACSPCWDGPFGSRLNGITRCHWQCHWHFYNSLNLT